MKILFVNKFLYPRGGAETYFLKIGEELARRGHEVEYFGMYDEKNTVGNSLHLATTNMDFHAAGPEKLLYPFRIVYSREAKRKLKEVIAAFGPDIVHFNNINFQLTPSVICAGAECGVPMVQTVHDVQMLCPNHMMMEYHSKKLCEDCMGKKSKWPCVKKRCIHGSLPKSLIGKVLRRILRDEEAARVAQGQGDEDRLLPTPDQPAAAPTRAQALGQQAGELLDKARGKSDDEKK